MSALALTYKKCALCKKPFKTTGFDWLSIVKDCVIYWKPDICVPCLKKIEKRIRSVQGTLVGQVTSRTSRRGSTAL